MVHYQDFSIKIEPERDGKFPVIVLRSPAGEGRSSFVLPFDQVGEVLISLESSVRGGRDVTADPTQSQLPQSIGDQLFNALLSGPTRSLYDRSLGMIHGEQQGLRIKLHIDPEEPSLLRLASLPWEFLYHKETREFVNLSRFTPIVRYLDVQRPSIPFPLEPPLHVLVAMASPADFPSLNLARERKLIEENWAGQADVQVDFLENASIVALQDRLVAGDYHVLHFMGHGEFDEQSGRGALVLEDAFGDSELVDGHRLGILLHDEPTTRLVFLNACETARVTREKGFDPFAGVASALVMAGIPAVVAMQFPITDQAAVTFARRFYPLLVRGFPVDAAVAEGRRAIRLAQHETMEWGTPVLFMRAPDGMIFEAGGELAPLMDELLPVEDEIEVESEPAHFFVSYKRHVQPDQQLAQFLYEFLTARGHTVFMDATMRAGEAWLEEIDRQIQDSDYLVVLLSPNSADSEMVQAEIRRAYDYRKLQGRPLTLPVRIAFEGLLPYSVDAFLDPLQYVKWQSEQDNQRVGHDILAAVAGRLPQQERIQMRPPDQVLVVSEDGRVVGDEDEIHPPLPEFDPRFFEELETPGGAVKLRDKLYVERDADVHLKRQVMRPGEITTIRASRQTGKSSLLVRGIHQARQAGAKVVNLDMQRVDSDFLQSAEVFLRYLAEFMVRKLRLDSAEVEQAWQGSLGAQDKLTYLMEDYILPETDGPIVLAMDEVDRLLQTPFHNDFFALIRFWHNSAAYDERWDQLNMVMVISTEPYLLIKDVNQSPFNVGLKLYLKDFDEEQIADLNQRHQSPVSAADFPHLVELLSGHPYLTRKALYTLLTEGETWAGLVRDAPSDQGPFGDHLRRYHWMLRNEPDLRNSLKQVIQRGKCGDEMAFFRLLRAGLVKGSGEVSACRCDLYRIYFKDKLG